MTKKERYDHILDYFRQQPRPTTELEFQTTYQLLVAVVLSAQCEYGYSFALSRLPNGRGYG